MTYTSGTPLPVIQVAYIGANTASWLGSLDFFSCVDPINAQGYTI
jgi:hypothetical protein